MIVATPVKGFTGTVVGVTFRDGVGETDNENALAYFRRHGYDLYEDDVAGGEEGDGGKGNPEGDSSTSAGDPATGEGGNGDQDPTTGQDETSDSSTPPADTEAKANADAEAEPVSKPAGNAPKQRWIDYALATGLTEADLDGLTQPQIRELVDQREK